MTKTQYNLLSATLTLTLFVYLVAPFSVFALPATVNPNNDSTGGANDVVIQDAQGNKSANNSLLTNPTDSGSLGQNGFNTSNNFSGNVDIYGNKVGDTAAADSANEAQINQAATNYSKAQYNGTPSAENFSGANNYGNAMGSCVGKIAGKYLAEYIGVSITNAVGSLIKVVTGTNTAYSTTAKSLQATQNATNVPTTNPAAYYQQEAANGISEDARKHAAEVNSQQNFLTPLVVCVANELVQQMTASTVQWINNGFKNPDGTSGPSFISNPQQFFTGIADREFGGFIQGLGPAGSLLCKPFDIKVRLALLNEYRGTYAQQSQCTLASIQGNVSNFGKKDYWSDWYELTQADNNNWMGSYFNARSAVASGIAYKQDANRLELTIGRGFLDLKHCPDGMKTCDESKMIHTTPGSEVQAQLDRVLNTQYGRINIANSFDDIVQALISKLLQMAFQGLSGKQQ